MKRDPDLFPKWVNGVRTLLAVGAGAGALYAGGIITFGFSPYATDVGYMPTQPVPYSHALHAGDLGIDCRYCHSTVEHTGKAAIPPTQTCLGCHTNIQAGGLPLEENTKLAAVKSSRDAGMPVEWVRVHDLPDFAYFNHSAHVNRGVGCVSCHGRIDRMEVVHQVEPLSMSWCLDCHRHPEKHLRPLDKITDMEWTATSDIDNPMSQLERGALLRDQLNINPSTDCSTCHR